MQRRAQKYANTAESHMGCVDLKIQIRYQWIIGRFVLWDPPRRSTMKNIRKEAPHGQRDNKENTGIQRDLDHGTHTTLGALWQSPKNVSRDFTSLASLFFITEFRINFLLYFKKDKTEPHHCFVVSIRRNSNKREHKKRKGWGLCRGKDEGGEGRLWAKGERL